MKISWLIVYIIFLFCNVAWAQNADPNLILEYSENQEMYFYEYSPALKIKADYTTLSQAANQYPEELMLKI